MNLRHLPQTIVLVALLFGALGLAWLARDTPLEPEWSRGLLRADGLSGLAGACTAALALAETTRAGRGRATAIAAGAALLWAAYLATHFAALAVLLLAAAIALGGRRPARLLPALLAGAGLALIALRAGAWRYPAPDSGLGMNSLSLALLLAAALGAAGVWALPAGDRPDPEPLLATGCLYALYRLFVLGPWNLGWLFAAMLLGAGVALWAAARAAAGPNRQAGGWLSMHLLGLALAGVGLSSGAGLALGAFALLALAPLRLALLPSEPAEEAGAEDGGRLLWLLTGAVPLSAPFVAAWAGVAGAMAGGLSLLALAIWGASLVAAMPLARMAARSGTGSAEPSQPGPARPPIRLAVAAGWSLTLGVGTPALVALLIKPAVAQLQAGLTPFGELTIWPWAGLLALDSARQPVASLPSLALAVLMIVLAALGWAVARLVGLWRERT